MQFYRPTFDADLERAIADRTLDADLADEVRAAGDALFADREVLHTAALDTEQRAAVDRLVDRTLRTIVDAADAMTRARRHAGIERSKGVP